MMSPEGKRIDALGAVGPDSQDYIAWLAETHKQHTEGLVDANDIPEVDFSAQLGEARDRLYKPDD